MRRTGCRDRHANIRRDAQPRGGERRVVARPRGIGPGSVQRLGARHAQPRVETVDGKAEAAKAAAEAAAEIEKAQMQPRRSDDLHRSDALRSRRIRHFPSPAGDAVAPPRDYDRLKSSRK